MVNVFALRLSPFPAAVAAVVSRSTDATDTKETQAKAEQRGAI
jgi:hypothetical protein